MTMTNTLSIALTCLCLSLWATSLVYSQEDTVTGSSIAESPGEKLHHQEIDQLDSSTGASSKAKKCTPILNFASQLADRNGSKTTEQQQSSSFAVGNIDLPIAPPGGSVNSAMRLLSAFDRQLIPGGDEEQQQDTLEDQNIVRFRQNKLHIQGLNLTMMNIHLYTQSEPKFALGVTIRNTTLSGQFQYNGPSLISESRLCGFYRMSIDNILITASSNLTKQKLDTSNESGPTEQQQHTYRLATNDFRMNISNLGYISIDIFDAQNPTKPTSNYWLKVLQRVLQKTIKRTYYSFENTIRQALEVEAKHFLDCELTRFNPILTGLKSPSNGTSINNALTLSSTTTTTSTTNNSALTQTDGGHNTNWNELADIINSEIVSSHLDQVALPSFNYQRSILGTEATIYFVNGTLSGLNHIRLNNDTRIKLQNEHLLINASLGWSDLKPNYNWSLFLGSPDNNSNTNDNRTGAAPTTRTPSSKGFVAFNIKRIDFDAVISKGLVGDDTRLVVDQLVIRRLDNPKMDIGGLPGMNRLARGLVNFFMGRLKQRIVQSIQPAMKQQLERSLNRLNLFP